jgi:hypothetical protein
MTTPRGKMVRPLPPLRARGFYELPPDDDEVPTSLNTPPVLAIDWEDPAVDVDHRGGLV